MRSTSIRMVKAREVLDCKGKPAIEVDVYTEGGAMGRASSPSGISAGRREAFVLRDGDLSRYGGMGVQKAVKFVETEIAPALVGMDIF
ncbi:MAG: enolase, partial [Firmicutes bacterium]|nr:enolase [Bacillota bacterium]